VFAFVVSLILYKVTDLIIPLRVTPEQEDVGLDLSQHGETALGADLLTSIDAKETSPHGTFAGTGA
jgi:Amt family ammonium transporter